MLLHDFQENTKALELTFLKDILSTNTTAHAKQIDQFLRQYPGIQSVNLNLCACRMIDSCGLAFLAAFYKEMNQRSVDLSLQFESPTIERLLKIIQLDKLATIEKVAPDA